MILVYLTVIFFLHCLAPVYFHFLFVIIYSSLFFVTVFNDVAACLSECGCLCECVCVQCFKNAFNVLNLRISLQYLSSVYVKRVHVCVQRHPKFAKSIPLTSGRLVCTVV